MKRSKVSILVSAVLVATLLGITGCAKKETSKEAAGAGTIKIAVAGPMTGDSAQYGEAFKRATELMAKKVNASGGVNGKNIELKVLDDKNDAKEAANVAQKLVEDKDIMAVVGHFSSTASLAAAPIYQKGGLVELSPTSSHPDFTKQGTFMFRNVNTQATEGPLLAKFASNELKAKKIAVIYTNNDWGITAKDNFVNNVKPLGVEITATEAFIPGQTKDFTPTLTKIKGTSPDLLFMAAMYSETGMITQQLQQINYKVPLLGTSSLNNEQLLKLAGPAVEGLIFTNNFDASNSDPKVQEFAKEFKATYGVEPDQFAAVAYDSLGMLVEVLKKSGPDRAKLRDELAKIKDYPGVSGKTSFDANRDVVKDMVFMQVKEGKFTVYKKK
jgi:branched-chain amino acid transport system substrate-binding protein